MLYHIPIPHLTPTDSELVWASQNLVPVALTALDKIYNLYGPKFDKADFDQQLFSKFDLAQRMREHISELGLSFRRFSVFLGYAGAQNARPHIDAHIVDVPMVARLNVPLQGQSGAQISWWNVQADDPRITARKFEQWDGKFNRMRTAFSYQSPPELVWGKPDYIVYDPGPCWNHVELAHQLDLDNTTEHRVNLTAELEPQVSWADLVDRLAKFGYDNLKN